MSGMTTRRNFLSAPWGAAAGARAVEKAALRRRAAAASPEDRRKAYTPVFAAPARQLGADFDLVRQPTGGMAVPWAHGHSTWPGWARGAYVLAHSATLPRGRDLKYDDKPIYFAIIIARPDLAVKKFPGRHARAGRSRSPTSLDLGG